MRDDYVGASKLLTAPISPSSPEPPFDAANSEAVALIETKGFSSGLYYAPEQAQAYARHFRSCQVVIVTNGYCYKTYLRQADGTFSTTPSAYLNILVPKDRYPLDPQTVGGALEVLRWLLPTTLHRRPGAPPPTGV